MARNAQNQANKTYDQSTALGASAGKNTSDLYGQLTPAYTQEATNPQGYSPTEMSDLTTGAEQSAGGALGADVGEASRLAASNRNFGSFAPALDKASRDASKNLGEQTLGINTNNANLKQVQRQEGLAGLSNLEGQQNNDVLASLGLQNQSTNTAVNAGNSGWFQQMLGLMSAASGAGKATAAINNSFGGGGADAG